jgi:hypothetical protein
MVMNKMEPKPNYQRRWALTTLTMGVIFSFFGMTDSTFLFLGRPCIALGIGQLLDVMSGKQLIVFGRWSLEELVRTGESNILRVMNVGLDQETMEIEKLATLVQDIRGHHDYHGASAT